MNLVLEDALTRLREHEAELRALGVLHAAIFGSVARGEAGANSDIDVLVELDRAHPMGLFEYSRLKLQIRDVLGESADVVNRATLKPLLRENILGDSINAF